MRAVVAGAVAGLVVAAFLAVLLLLALPAKAQAVSCYPFEEYGAGLKTHYGEEKVAHGQASAGSAVVLFVNPYTQTWTLVVRPADRPLACPVLAGEGWESFEPEPVKPRTQTH